MRQGAFYKLYLLICVTIEKRKKVNIVMEKLKFFFKKWGFFLIIPLVFILTFDYRMIQPSIVERPANFIYDPNHRLNRDTEDKLLQFNRSNETQLGIYIVDTLGFKSLESTSLEIARKWKIGYEDSNKGVLLVIAVNDRKMRIETSNQVAMLLTDAESYQILEDSKPLMKEKRYNEAVSNIISAIHKEVNDEPLTVSKIELNKEKLFSTPTSEMVRNIPSEDLLGMSGAIILVIFMAILNFIPLLFIGLLVLLFIIGFINHKKGSKNKEFKFLGIDLTKVIFVPAKHSSSKTKWDSEDSSTDHDSSSSSGSDWGGGGFDGGGSSSSW